MKKIKTQALVVGGGSGGFGALWALAKRGVRTVLIEKNAGLGGTSVYGGINCYEPGVCSGELHALLRCELEKTEGASAVCKTIPRQKVFGDNAPDNDKYHWGYSVTDNEASYEDTLKRCISMTGGDPDNYRRYQFEPEAMERAMLALLEPYRENITLLFNTEFIDCRCEGRKIKEVFARGLDGEEYAIEAEQFVDCSGDIHLARAAGCEVALGSDGKKYGEPHAGEVVDERTLNGASIVFRIRKTGNRELPEKIYTEQSRHQWACFNSYPDGSININMLPTIDGYRFLSLGEQGYEVGKQIALEFFNYLQLECGMLDYTLEYVFPMAGIREGYRLVGRHVLTENDIRSNNAFEGEKIAAIADHPMDIHGGDACLREVQVPYRIPMSCLEPKEIDNLLVACRGASFSHIAAASARLSRTMLTLGESAGEELASRILN